MTDIHHHEEGICGALGYHWDEPSRGYTPNKIVSISPFLQFCDVNKGDIDILKRTFIRSINAMLFLEDLRVEGVF
jgi:hypothetical protein